MAGTERAWADEVTTTGTEQLYPLGTTRLVNHATYGLGTWVYIQCLATSLAQGHAAGQPNAQADPYKVTRGPASADPQRIRGVADHAIAVNGYGWIIKQGRCILNSNGTTTADTAQEPSGTAGQWTDKANIIEHSVAWAYETENPAGAGNPAGGYVNCQ